MSYIVPDDIPSLPSDSDSEFDCDIGEENEEQLPDEIDGISRKYWQLKNEYSYEETIKEIIEENQNTTTACLSYKEVLLKNKTEISNRMNEKSKLSNDRKSPFEFCQKLGSFLNFSHFDSNQSVDMGQFEEFIRNEYCDFLDDEDLNILEKICSGDMGCFAIFEKCIGQFMNCQFCFTKSIENEKIELETNSTFRPSYAEIVEFVAYFETRIQEVCTYLKPKIYSVFKFSKIAHAVLWDYCQFSTFEMLNFILNEQQLWEKFVYDFEYLFDFYSELNKRRISLKQSAENHTFFEFLLDNLAAFYSRIPNDQEITILNFEEIIENTLGDDLNEFDRMYIDQMVKGKKRAVEGFREKLGDYFQVGMKGGILLIKKKNIGKIEIIPVENSNQEIFEKFHDTTKNYQQNIISQIVPKSAMKTRSERLENNCDILARGTQTNIEYSEDIAKCVEYATEKVMRNYVHFEDREMRLIERFFKEFTSTLGIDKEILMTSKHVDSNVELSKENAEQIRITQDQLEKSEKNCAEKDEIIKQLRNDLSELHTTDVIMKSKLLKVEANCSVLESQNRVLQKDISMHLNKIHNLQTKLVEQDIIIMKNQLMLNLRQSPCPQIYLFPPIILRQNGTNNYLNNCKKKYYDARLILETVCDKSKLLSQVEYEKFMNSMKDYERKLVHDIHVCERNGSEQELTNASLPIFSGNIQYIIYKSMGSHQQNNSVCSF